MSLNFQVHPFVGNDLSRQDTDGILELLSLMDSAVIGPGIARTKASLEAQQRVIVGATCPLVLDASALQPTIPAAIRGKQCVLTPHRGELERLGIPLAQVGNKAREWGVVILLKGPSDHVFTPDGTQTEVRGGNAGLTVGGTGDALAGLIAGFLAQRLAPLDACVLASTLIKQAGEFLSKDHGYTYTTHQVIKQIPLLLTRQRG
jgi:NAD(P)H-hydrate epimerase